MKKFIITLLTIVLFVSTLTTTLTYPVDAAEESVIDVINALANGTYSSNSNYLKYKIGNYFNSKITSACSPHTSSNGCPDKTCISGNVTINGTKYSGSQCMGFAYDVFRIIHGERHGVTDIAASKITWDGVTDPATWIRNTVQPGDYIRFGGHSAIVVGTTSQYLRLYEANGYYSEYQTQPCRVTINANRSWSSVSTKISNIGGSLFVWRATINSSTSPSVSDIWHLSPPDGVLSMRTSATTSATKICDIPGGKYVTVTKYANDGKWDWGYTTYNGQTGWVCLYYATKHTSHAYDSWQTVTTADCTTVGSQKRTCSCGAFETQSISALGHNYSLTFTVDTPATCSTAGVKSKHCTRCSEKNEVTVISALGHAYGNWQTVATAGCTSTGSQKRVCSTCSYTEYKTISALGHNYSTLWTTDKTATCTTSGSKSRHCTRCTAKSDITTVAANGHSWSDWKVTKQATYEATGTKVRRCTTIGCSAQEMTVIAKLSLDGHIHNFGEWVTQTIATCDHNGMQRRTCSICKSAETRELKALGHIFGDWVVEKVTNCIEDGIQKRTCFNCHEVETLSSPALGHIFDDWIEKDAATQDHEGLWERKCYNCSKTETQNTPKLTVSDISSTITSSAEPTTSPNPICDQQANNEANGNLKITTVIIVCTVIIVAALGTMFFLIVLKKQ